MAKAVCAVLGSLVARALLAGTTIIHVATEGNGALVANTGQVNWNGAFFWYQGWGLNETYGHMFFMDLRTMQRIKTYATTVVSATQPASDVFVWDLFRVERRRVAVREEAAGSGRSHMAIEFRGTLAGDNAPADLARDFRSNLVFLRHFSEESTGCDHDHGETGSQQMARLLLAKEIVLLVDSIAADPGAVGRPAAFTTGVFPC